MHNIIPHPNFAHLLEEIIPAFEKLMDSEPHIGPAPLALFPKGASEKGVYLFSEAGEHLYVGRTNRVRKRYREHIIRGHNGAPFAFNLAKKQCPKWDKTERTREDLSSDSTFSPAFLAAKKRVSVMEFRWVQIDDPNCQCILEIYAALVLNTEYNTFENH